MERGKAPGGPIPAVAVADSWGVRIILLAVARKMPGMKGSGPYLAHTRCGRMPGSQSPTGAQLQPICSAWMGPQEG